MKKLLLIFLSSYLFVSLVTPSSYKMNALVEGTVNENEVVYNLGTETIDLTEIKGFKFDFNPTSITSYNVEITDCSGNVWSTSSLVSGVNGDKGSGVLLSSGSNASYYYTNVFDSLAADSYKIYIPFDFYSGQKEKNNKVINPVFKIKGYNDGLGVSIDDTTYDLPTSLNGTIKFVSTNNECALALKDAISNIELVSDDDVYTKALLNVDSTIINTALDGYNELSTRQTVEFNTKTTVLKWSAGTGLGTAAGFMLKMGNTGANDIKIRFTIAENGEKTPAGLDAMTESYSGKTIDENEYYQFIHGANSIKTKGTIDKVYITSRKVLIPAGYQGLLFVPFSRLRWQADGYINSNYDVYYNGRLDSVLGTIRLYVDNISEEAAKENSLTFYFLNAIKAIDGKGISYKVVGANSNASSVKVDSNIQDQVIISSTAPSTVSITNKTSLGTENIVLSTPNSGDNAAKLYIGQTATITVTNIDKNRVYVPHLFSDNEDLSSCIVEESKTDNEIVYKYRKIKQSHGNVTFSLTNAYSIKVLDGTNELASKNVESGDSYEFAESIIEKEHYTIKTVKVSEDELTSVDGKYSITNIHENKTVNITYEAKRYSVSINKDEHSNYSVVGELSPSYFDEIKICLSADTGYEIDKVLVNENEVEVVNNEVILKEFVKDVQISIVSCLESTKIVVSKEGNGSYTLDKNKVNVVDNKYTLNVTPDENNKINSVKVDGQEVTLTNNSYEGVYTGNEITIVVIFEPIIYTITVNELNHGLVSYSNGDKISYYDNSTLTISCDEGYEINSVKVDGEKVTLTSNAYTFEKVCKNVNVEVDIKPIVYQITVIVNDKGTYTIDRTQVDVENNTFKLTLNPNENYEIKEIVVNGEKINVTNNVYNGTNLKKDIAITVTFTLKKYKINVEEANNGKIKVSNSSVSHGSSLKVTLTPDDGYVVECIIINGEEISIDDTEYYLSNVTDEVTVSAKFKKEVSSKPFGCKGSLTTSLWMIVILFALLGIRKKGNNYDWSKR